MDSRYLRGIGVYNEYMPIVRVYCSNPKCRNYVPSSLSNVPSKLENQVNSKNASAQFPDEDDWVLITIDEADDIGGDSFL